MTTNNTNGFTETASSESTWKQAVLGIFAGSGAGICCAGPIIFGTLGFSGIASSLASLPFVYHVILQWVALAIMIGAWIWFYNKWSRMAEQQRWSRIPVITGLILTGASGYVVLSWITHVFI